MTVELESTVRPARILVVDDERHIARLLEYVLRKEGYEVQIAHDGEAALAAVEHTQPDAVLLDLVLPGISGLEVLKALRSDKQRAGLTIAVLSARSFEDMPSELIEAGANFHCTKPVAPSTLLRKLVDVGVPPKLNVQAQPF
ncbi:MAG: response regulator [Acidobacteria bacterium]|nr:response regulator [Acidobacteriota bacterium]MCW5967412.1 response regulator [Blastocatellales bacterium]